MLFTCSFSPQRNVPSHLFKLNMQYIAGILIHLVAASTLANEPPSAQVSDLEKRLSAVEFRTTKFISGKEKMQNGFASLPPHLRKITCGAYPVESDKDLIKSLKEEIAALERDKTISQLNAEQMEKLSVQKGIVDKLTPGVDCSAFK